MRQAFAHLYASCDRWPTPKQLLDAIPADDQQLLLAPPPLTDEDKRRGLERLAQLSAAVYGPQQPAPNFSSRAELDRYINEQVAKAKAQNNVRKK